MNISTDKCLAGELCQQQEEEMILDGEKVNTGRCHICKSPCHYTCLYEKKWIAMTVKCTAQSAIDLRWCKQKMLL